MEEEIEDGGTVRVQGRTRGMEEGRRWRLEGIVGDGGGG